MSIPPTDDTLETQPPPTQTDINVDDEVPTILSSTIVPTLLPTQADSTSTAPSVRPSTPRPSAASLSMTTMPTQSGTNKVQPVPNMTLDVSMALPNSSSPSLSSSPMSSPLNETMTPTEATFSTTELDKEDDDEPLESTTTTATTTSSTDDLWSNLNDTSSVVIDLLGSTSEGLNGTNSSINGMNDTKSIDDEGSNSTEQNTPTSAPQSSTVSANKELDQTNHKGTTQEKEGLPSGATAGIVIAVLAILLLVLAAFLIHRRREQDNQASSEVVDEEAGLDLDDSACRDGSNRGEAIDLRHVEPSSPTRSVANSDDYIGVIVDE